MTAIENSTLERIEGKVDKLMEFMAASNERVPNCKKRFEDIETDVGKIGLEVGWIKSRILIFMGIAAALVWVLDKFLSR